VKKPLGFKILNCTSLPLFKWAASSWDYPFSDCMAYRELYNCSSSFKTESTIILRLNIWKNYSITLKVYGLDLGGSEVLVSFMHRHKTAWEWRILNANFLCSDMIAKWHTECLGIHNICVQFYKIELRAGVIKTLPKHSEGILRRTNVKTNSFINKIRMLQRNIL
jgi:hypothetical protein